MLPNNIVHESQVEKDWENKLMLMWGNNFERTGRSGCGGKGNEAGPEFFGLLQLASYAPQSTANDVAHKQ